MRFDILTLFPDLVSAVLGESIIGRACKSGAITIKTHQIRDYSTDKHHRVDDTTYGGGMGMLMAAPPLYNCFQGVKRDRAQDGFTGTSLVIYLSPAGSLLTQSKAKELADYDGLILLCGHYEGIDQRIIDELVDEEISIGDYVLTGGEIPACILVDAVARLVPGVLSDPKCHEEESISSGLLEYPQYTKPAVFHDRSVPEVLLNGDHAKVDRWRLEQSLERTRERRPDLYEKYMAEHPEPEKKKKH